MKRILYKTLLGIFIIVLLSVVIIEGLILFEGGRTSTEKVDYVIVLGARLYGDIPSPALLERLKVAKTYLLENKDTMVVVSGGQGPDEYISEASAMKIYLLRNGVEDNRIIIEDKSTSTFENLKFSLEKIKEQDNRNSIKVLIATNKYHIFRSKLLARRLGMEPYGLPAKIPFAIVLNSYFREYFAVLKSLLYDRV